MSDLTERIDTCKWCDHKVKFIGKNSLPHTIEGNDYMPSDHMMHIRQCSDLYWADRKLDEAADKKIGG